MMLNAKLDEKRVPIWNATQGEPYVCPDCGMPVVPHKGPKVIHHFKHKAKSDCPYGAGETRDHLEAKTLLQQAFRSRGIPVESETSVNCLSRFGNRRADLMTYPPGRSYSVAIELQKSIISENEFEMRSKAYARANIYVLWIPFIEQIRLHTDEIEIQPYGSKIHTFSRYSARPWEKSLFKLVDEVWYYEPRKKMFWNAISIKSCNLEVPNSEFYVPGGELQSFRGYVHESKRWVELKLRGPYPPEALKVTRSQNKKRGLMFAHFVGG